MGILALNLAEPHDVRDSRIHLAAGVLAVLALVAALCLLAGYGAFWGLLLGAPLVAIAKVVFDRIESLKPAGELVGR